MSHCVQNFIWLHFQPSCWPLGLWNHKISWLLSEPHLVVGFWTTRLTYLFKLATRSLYPSSSLCFSILWIFLEWIGLLDLDLRLCDRFERGIGERDLDLSKSSRFVWKPYWLMLSCVMSLSNVIRSLCQQVWIFVFVPYKVLENWGGGLATKERLFP